MDSYTKLFKLLLFSTIANSRTKLCIRIGLMLKGIKTNLAT